jgi:hypothetical protein
LREHGFHPDILKDCHSSRSRETRFDLEKAALLRGEPAFSAPIEKADPPLRKTNSH